MDSTTRKVMEMYSRFPYPSPARGRKKYLELANLLRLFCLETDISLKGMRVLDAGTGTGHRLIEAASVFPDTDFVGVDVSETAIEIAKEIADAAGIENLEFKQADLMDLTGIQGAFDVVLCMGVLHHTADPARVLRSLKSVTSKSGLLFLYVYGKWGAHERMRRKNIVAVLLGDDPEIFERGIQLVRDLEYGLEEYGWKLDEKDRTTVDAQIVDSYLNVNDRLFDLEELSALMRQGNLHGFVPYGITIGREGLLFDAFPEDSSRMMGRTTDFREVRKSDTTRLAFDALDRESRFRLADLVYQPNGYTLLGLREATINRLDHRSRLVRNAHLF